MDTYIKDAILFIHEYRNMENADLQSNERLIKRVISPKWKADHLVNSWSGRENDFGDFFLNLSHDTQADFMEGWGIEVIGKQEYKTALAENPAAILFAKPPLTVTWLHELVKYFYNNGIGDGNDLILSNLPEDDKCYGNSTTVALTLAFRFLISKHFSLTSLSLKEKPTVSINRVTGPERSKSPNEDN